MSKTIEVKPRVKPTVLFTDSLIEFDRSLFGVDEMPEEQIRVHARTLAEKIAVMPMRPTEESVDGSALEKVRA
jgi:hypothetical protein